MVDESGRELKLSCSSRRIDGSDRELRNAVKPSEKSCTCRLQNSHSHSHAGPKDTKLSPTVMKNSNMFKFDENFDENPKWAEIIIDNQDHQKNATPGPVYMGPLKILNLQKIAQRGLSFIQDVRNHARF